MSLAHTSEVNFTRVVTQVPSMKPVAQDVQISGQVLRLFQWVCYTTCILVDIFGTITNIINIICFVKQGFKDPVNISLFGLAISDLASLVTLIWTCLCVVPAFQEAFLPFIPTDIQYVITGIPHVIFTRITSCITALITLERCLCVIMPLKANPCVVLLLPCRVDCIVSIFLVAYHSFLSPGDSTAKQILVKNIMTPNTVTGAIVCIFVILIVSAVPYLSIMRLTAQFYPDKNRTLLGLTYTANRDVLELYFFSVNNFLVPFSAFLVIIISMLILVFKLRQQTLWRAKSLSSGSNSTTAERDLKVSRMVIMISSLFVACFVPSGVLFLAMAMVPGLQVGGKHEDLLILVYGVGTFLESTNSSMNIFIYYYMSTKYRQIFNQIFKKEQIHLPSSPRWPGKSFSKN